MYLPHLVFEDRSFGALVLPNCHLETLWTGARWMEGPAWFPAGRYLVFSDIPNDRMMRYDDTDGSVSVFRAPSMNSNGNTRDRQGRLITCHHLGRCVTRTEFDGTVTLLADRFDGKRLNSPNDVVVSSDGAIWFTDPTYGIDMDYEGKRVESEIGASNVYRIDPASGAVTAVATDFVKPNGLAFSPDESVLYVADTGASHVENGPRHIRRFGVNGASLTGGAVLADCSAGLFDGFRCDRLGNLWCSSAEGVHCLNSDGALIGRLIVPEVVANVCFGGAKMNRLFITGTTTLYATFLNISGW